MKCPFCTTPLPEATDFCPGCGRKVEPPVEERLPDSSFPVTEAPVPVDAEASAAAPGEKASDPRPEAVAPESTEAPVPREEVSHPEAPVEESTAPAAAVQAERKPLLRPLRIPLLVLTLVFLFGLGVYFLFPDEPAELPPETTSPSLQDPDKPPLPPVKQDNSDNGGLRDESFVPAPDKCFLVTEEGIYFLPQLYTGGPVLVIPNEIIGEPVTAIAPGGFAELTGITTVVLPDGLETIGAEAFRDCPEIRGMYIPESVRSIGENAFANCKSLESVSISASMESIGTGAFSGCSALRFIFYTGTFQQWQSLYYEYVNPFAYACCSDGDYYHGVNLP